MAGRYCVPIELSWDDEAETMLYINIILPWDWDDFRAVTAETKVSLTPVTDKHGILVDVREAGDMPPAGFLTESRHALREIPPLPMAFIANTDVMRVIFLPIVRIMPTRRQFFFVRTLEEAREAIFSSNP
jgi:hypothetical protein